MLRQIRLTIFNVGLICLALNLNGQTKPPSTPSSTVGKLEMRQHALELSTQQAVADLQEQIKELQNKVDLIDARITSAYKLLGNVQFRRDSVDLNLTETSFQKLDTASGFVLISTESVVPYLTGYKIQLKIGNPLSASYSGFTAHLKWGKAYDWKQFSDQSYGDWQKSLQVKEILMPELLESGTWNKIELIVTPATAEQLGYVNLSLSTDIVRLYQK